MGSNLKDSEMTATALEGASPALRAQAKPYYCPRCDTYVSASDVAAGVVCRSSRKVFAGSPCYFDDRAWGRPAGSGAASSRDYENRNQPRGLSAAEAPTSAEGVNKEITQ